MDFKQSIAVVSVTVMLAASGTVLAQDRPDDAAVWSVIEAQWEATQNGESKWIDAALAEDFTGWNKGNPTPRTKESVKMWDKFQSEQWDGQVHELYPLSIVVHDDTAVAHYLYSTAGEDSDGETEVIHGRYTDVLVRVEGEWKFIAWHGGADSDNDD